MYDITSKVSYIYALCFKKVRAEDGEIQLVHYCKMNDACFSRVLPF